jgi:hypothetical protein
MDTDPTPLTDPRQTRIPIGGTSLLPPTLPPARAGRLLGIGRRQTSRASTAARSGPSASDGACSCRPAGSCNSSASPPSSSSASRTDRRADTYPQVQPDRDRPGTGRGPCCRTGRSSGGRGARVRGSVYAHTTKRGERRWRVVFDALPDPLTGERRQTSKRGFATKAAAEAFLRRSLEKVTAGTYTQPSRVTVAEYLAEWLDGLRKKPTTMADYRQSARVYMGPRIGGVPLQSLTPEHLDRLYRELETQGKACRTVPDRRGHLPRTRLLTGPARRAVTQGRPQCPGMLHRALQEAAERRHVPRNVASLAHPPTAKQARSHNTRDKS